MNKEDIIRMAREAGFYCATRQSTLEGMIERFAAIVAAAEREACAKDKQDAERYRHMRNNAQFQSRNGPGLYWYLPQFSDGKVRDEGQQLDDAIDAAIRARGQA
jgi:hypothetical protein